jgi:hypothetical protein
MKQFTINGNSNQCDADPEPEPEGEHPHDGSTVSDRSNQWM